MKRIEATKTFDKHYTKLFQKIQVQFRQRVAKFLQDPAIDQLHDRPLHGSYAGYLSINFTGDIRALYLERSETIITFAFISPYSQLYRK